MRYIGGVDRAEVIDRLKAAEPELRARGVAALFLYGSYARDEARPDSDIDIMVEFTETADKGLVGYMAPYEFLEGQFPGTEVGYSTREGISKYVLPYAEDDAIKIF